MGRKVCCFTACFSHDSKAKKYQKTAHPQNDLPVEVEKLPDPSPQTVEIVTEIPLPPPSFEDVKLTFPEIEQTNHVYSVPTTTAVDIKPDVVAPEIPEAAPEVVQPAIVSLPLEKTKEEIAAIKIQTAFRGYLARRALRALRGLVRLKTLVNGSSVKRQTATTLRCMQTMARVQSQIRARRIRMSEENHSLQRLLQQKHEKEFEKLKMGEEWDDSMLFKEQIEANLMHKYEAAIRRERALAYAYSVQQTWKNTNSANPTYMDPNNPHWGWSWLERWMAARPWESRHTTEKEFNDQASVKSNSHSVGGEISKAYALRELNGDKPSPTAKKPRRPASHQSPSTPPSKATSVSSVTGKFKSGSPHGSLWMQDDDSRSTVSMHSERHRRRHSLAGSSVRDDESEGSSPAVPSYMTPTKSAKAKSRMQSPLGIEKNDTPERGSAKKRLSFPASPARPRRHSGPPKMESSPMKDIEMNIEQTQ